MSRFAKQILFLGLTGGLVLHGPAYAFKGVEHVALTNEAMEIALLFLEREGVDGELRTYLRRELLDTQAGEKASLGEVTSAIDYVRSATRFLERSGSFSCFGAAAGMESVPQLRESLLNLLRSARGNDAHFANEAIASYQLWHTAAMALARNARSCPEGTSEKWRSLRGALIVEGAALHYLQDALASGHIVTPRRRMHNIPSRLLHDRYNRRGMEFTLDLPVYESELACLLGQPPDLQWLSDDERALATSALARLEPLNPSDAERTLTFYGDGHLRHSCVGETSEAKREDGEASKRHQLALERTLDHCSQRIVITLASARGLTDVLLTYLLEEGSRLDEPCVQPSKSLSEFSWRPMRRSVRAEGTGTGYEKKRILTLNSGGFGFGEWRPDEKEGRLFYHGWALGLTASGQGAFFEGSQYDARGLFDLELLVGLLAPGKRVGPDDVYVDKKFQWALIPGFTYVSGPDLHGEGLSLRLVASAKDLDYLLGVETAYRKLRQRGMEDYALYYGIRSDLGVGFLTYFLAVGRDEFFGELGELERRAVVRAGFTLALPSTLLFRGKKH